MTAEDEAKQLDSVTDRVQEVELDAGKAQEAMTALSSANKDEDSKAAALAAITVAKEDVALIVSELEVSDEVAERVLREVALDGAEDGKMLEAALRKLVST